MLKDRDLYDFSEYPAEHPNYDVNNKKIIGKFKDELNSIRHTSSLQLHPHTHHIVTPGFVDRPAGVTALLARWTEKLAGGPQAGTSDSPH